MELNCKSHRPAKMRKPQLKGAFLARPLKWQLLLSGDLPCLGMENENEEAHRTMTRRKPINS